MKSTPFFFNTKFIVFLSLLLALPLLSCENEEIDGFGEETEEEVVEEEEEEEEMEAPDPALIGSWELINHTNFTTGEVCNPPETGRPIVLFVMIETFAGETQNSMFDSFSYAIPEPKLFVFQAIERTGVGDTAWDTKFFDALATRVFPAENETRLVYQVTENTLTIEYGDNQAMNFIRV